MRPIASTFGTEQREIHHSSISEGSKRFYHDIKGGGQFPWKKRPLDRVREWFVSPKMQLAAQVAVAQIWAGSFTFVR